MSEQQANHPSIDLPAPPQSAISNPQSAIAPIHGPALWPLRPDSPAQPETEQNWTELNTKNKYSPDNPAPTPLPDLAPRKQTAVSLLLAGHTFSAVAAILGISRTTLYAWNRDPAFLLELARRRHEVRRASDDRLSLLMLQSTQTALESLRAPETLDRYKHAFRLLTLLRPYLPILDQPRPPLPHADLSATLPPPDPDSVAPRSGTV